MEEDKCGSKGGRRVGKQRVLIKRKTYAYAAKDVSELMTRFDFRPKIGDDGKPEGMIISNVKPNAIIIRRMGLRNGDMVKSFEGQKVHSRDDLMKLFESLKSAHSLYVQIQRRGIDHTLKYDIR